MEGLRLRSKVLRHQATVNASESVKGKLEGRELEVLELLKGGSFCMLAIYDFNDELNICGSLAVNHMQLLFTRFHSGIVVHRSWTD